jgi:hypothetical protein
MRATLQMGVFQQPVSFSGISPRPFLAMAILRFSRTSRKCSSYPTDVLMVSVSNFPWARAETTMTDESRLINSNRVFIARVLQGLKIFETMAYYSLSIS